MKIVIDNDDIIEVEKFKIKEYLNVKYVILKLNSIWEIYEFNTGLRIMPLTSYDKNFSKTKKGLEQNLFKFLDNIENRKNTLICIDYCNWLNNLKTFITEKNQ